MNSRQATSEVEAVVINWRRPANVERIVEALRSQTVRPLVTVVDASDEGHSLPAAARAGADRVHRLADNYGPYNRYCLAPTYDRPYTLLLDDDGQPGLRAVEHMLGAAEATDDWSVLGQYGRVFGPGGAYNSRRVDRQQGLVAVDVVVMGYLVRTHDLVHVDALRRRLGLRLPVREDDLLLAAALQTATQRPSRLTPADADVETKLARTHLPEQAALSSEPDHGRLRDDFLGMLQRDGWKPDAHRKSAVYGRMHRRVQATS